MVEIINPEVDLIDYGPELIFKDGTKITPDELLVGAGKVTFKDVGALEELIELKKKGELSREQIITAHIKSTGVGHASMATTPGFWFFMRGNSSKLVDSIFTAVRFGSGLMPSGRRIEIAEEQILMPKGIAEKSEEVQKIYIKASKRNIQTYKRLMERNVSKQEASKIVQYGHRGGGFMFLPLETFVSLQRSSSRNTVELPQEGREIISLLEGFISDMGMDITYESRKSAPRTSCPNPCLFTLRNNLAQEYAESKVSSPMLLGLKNIPSEKRDERLRQYLELRKRYLSSEGGIIRGSKDLLDKLDEIAEDNINSIDVTTGTRIAWRVHGEVKRHRTMPQVVQSIYHTISIANKIREESKGLLRDMKLDVLMDKFSPILSIPGSVKTDNKNLELWFSAFFNSLDAYHNIRTNGVSKSDAVAVIPRGIKVGVVKTYDLYNLLTGYMPLRLCGTAEPEMRRTTEQEFKLIKQLGLPQEFIDSIGPKCHSIGYCPEVSYKRCCGRVKEVNPDYDKDFHDKINGLREEKIRRNLQT